MDEKEFFVEMLILESNGNFKFLLFSVKLKRTQMPSKDTEGYFVWKVLALNYL